MLWLMQLWSSQDGSISYKFCLIGALTMPSLGRPQVLEELPLYTHSTITHSVTKVTMALNEGYLQQILIVVTISAATWSWFKCLVTCSQLWHHNILQLCVYHLKLSLPATDKESQWGSQREVAKGFMICLTTATGIAAGMQHGHVMPCFIIVSLSDRLPLLSKDYLCSGFTIYISYSLHYGNSNNYHLLVLIQ